MKIILLKDVPKVGRKYDVKEVSEGYALNMLIPRGLAQIANANAIAKVDALKANDLTQKKIEDELLSKNLSALQSLTITMKEKANDKGHLFAGITKEVLAKEVEKAGRIKIDPESIILSKPVKEVGKHKIQVEVNSKKAEFTLVIEAK